MLNGATVPTFAHFVERGVFGPSESGRFVQPRVPFRISGEPGDHARHEPTHAGSLPLSGVRVVDCTAWWAGPAATAALACLGADVIKVESITRPDLMRYASTRPPTTDEWWEWSPAVPHRQRREAGDHARPHATRGHRGVRAPCSRTADVLVENYTPRVMEQFGLGWDRVHEINPDLVMTRMPAFGLDGPWRDNTGFAQTMECISGMAWLTGFADGPPVLVRGACDPLAGMHAVIATLLALLDRDAERRRPAHRSHDGRGRVERSRRAGARVLRDRHGADPRWQPFAPARRRKASTGARARTAGWRSPSRATNNGSAFEKCSAIPAWATASDLDTHAGAGRRTTTIDSTCGPGPAIGQPADRARTYCVPPACRRRRSFRRATSLHNPQLRHRGLFEIQPHRVTGAARASGTALPVQPRRPVAVRARRRRSASTTTRSCPSSASAPDDIVDSAPGGIVGERPTGL